MASLAGAKVVALRLLGKGGVTLFTLEVGDKKGDVKAYTEDVKDIKVGHEFKSGETEKRPPYNKPDAPESEHETWIKSAPKGKGGGGAGMQEASKAKNAVIEKTSASKNASINYAANLKSATTCLELAVSTLGADQDLNAYRERAFDLYQIIQEVATVGSAQAK